MKEIVNHQGIILLQENYLQETIDEVMKDIFWRNDFITMFGKTHPLPRLTAWHGDEGLTQDDFTGLDSNAKKN